MPSAAFAHWQTDRMVRLGFVDAHCATLLVASSLAPPPLSEESLQGYVMLVSGHFQGFCRDLYGECVQVFAAASPQNLRDAVQTQFGAELKLDPGNPTTENIRKDFERFGITLDLTRAAPGSANWITHLGHLNYWRNAVAHQKAATPPAGIPASLTLPQVQIWRAACDGLATVLDAMLLRKLSQILGFAPW